MRSAFTLLAVLAVAGLAAACIPLATRYTYAVRLLAVRFRILWYCASPDERGALLAFLALYGAALGVSAALVVRWLFQ